MMNKKRIITVLAVLVLCVVLVMTCVACGEKPNNNGGSGKATYDITMWVSEIDGVSTLFQQQVEAFNAQSDLYHINATISGVSEGESATQMIADVETGADIFCFAQDQLSRLVQANALQYLGTAAADAVRQNNDASAVAAATIGSGDDARIYCYPLTSDNGYFMFYDKSVIDEAHLDDMTALIADCAEANKLFAFDLSGSGWYSAAYFFGAGCVSSWETPDGKTFTSVTDTYNSEAGVIAMKGMQELINSKVYLSSAEASVWGTDAAVLISGTWVAETTKEELGENYGVAKLPHFTVDGTSYQLGSFSGNKLLGVKPTRDLERAKALQALATYLTSEECQVQRFESFGWGPSNKAAQASEAVAADETLAALAAQNQYAVPQGQIPGKWWDLTKALVAADIGASEDGIRAALAEYDTAIRALADPNYVPGNDATVIGNMFGDTGWTIDHPMTSADGIWTTDYPIYCQAGAEFKVRFGKTWDNGEFGDGGANYTVAEAGLYWIKANAEAKTIELVAAQFGAVGSFNGWGEGADDEILVANEDGTLSATLKLEAGAAVKVRVDSVWTLNFGEGGVVNGDNIVVGEAGSYVVTMAYSLSEKAWVLTVAPVVEE